MASPENVVMMADLDLKDLRVNADLRDHKDNLDPLDLLVLVEKVENVDLRENLDSLVKMV